MCCGGAEVSPLATKSIRVKTDPNQRQLYYAASKGHLRSDTPGLHIHVAMLTQQNPRS